MAGTVKSNLTPGRTGYRRGTEEPPLIKWTLIVVALAFALVFLLLPLANVFYEALRRGFVFYIRSLSEPDTRSAIRLTLLIAAISVPLNLVVGLASPWASAKFDFRAKARLLTLIALPVGVSPVVSGMVELLLFGLQGYFGAWLDEHDIQIIFAVPGMVLATTFVTFPFVARELIPVMRETGSEQEQAALTLGANGLQTFWHVTLPSVKWGLLYGVILCNARAMGEYGAVYVVSAHIMGQTETMSLRVASLYEDLQGGPAAFALASLLALLALVTLWLKTFVEWRTQREYDRAQHSPAGAPLETGRIPS